jgi:tRNA/rRNA methyltransferase
MVRNLRSLFQRAQCTEQELRTLHGVVTAFAGPRERKAPEEMAEPAGGASGETAR